jgi:hypothetical protein
MSAKLRVLVGPHRQVKMQLSLSASRPTSGLSVSSRMLELHSLLTGGVEN